MTSGAQHLLRHVAQITMLAIRSLQFATLHVDEAAECAPYNRPTHRQDFLFRPRESAPRQEQSSTRRVLDGKRPKVLTHHPDLLVFPSRASHSVTHFGESHHTCGHYGTLALPAVSDQPSPISHWAEGSAEFAAFGDSAALFLTKNRRV